MSFVEQRACPVCGLCGNWRWGLMRHWLDGVKIVHVQIVVSGAAMASILVNGKALTK